MTLYTRHATAQNNDNITNTTRKRCRGGGVLINPVSSYNIICQDAEDVLKETYKENIMTSLTNYTKQQQQIQHYLFFLFLCLLFFTLFISFILSVSIHHHDTSKGRIKSNGDHFKIRSEKRVVYYMDLIPSNNYRNVINNKGDYNGLIYKPIPFNQGRIIQDYNDNKGKVLHNEDDDNYDKTIDDNIIKEKNGCRAIPWYKSRQINCNTLHELSLKNNTQFINNGFWRDVLQYKEIIIKTIRFKGQFNQDYYEMIRIDALVMEKLTSSNYIATIYGYCGTSILQESFIGDIRDIVVPTKTSTNQNGDTLLVYTRNKFKPHEKLKIALEIAYPLYELHYFDSALIVHNDMQLGQYLYTLQNQLKLNDFNRAEILLFNKNLGKYCEFRNGHVYGRYRSPEEVKDGVLNEKIDVYSYGNLVYNLLTGLVVYHDMTGGDDDEDVQDKIKNGELPYIDPNYETNKEERVLVQLIQRCWAYNPGDRPNFKQIITYLQTAIRNSGYEEDMIRIDWNSFTTIEEDDD